MQKPPNLLWLTPMRGSLNDEAVATWVAAMLIGRDYWTKRYPGAQFAWVGIIRCHIEQARNWGAYKVLKEGWDWAMWMDDDAIPPVDILAQLHEKNKDWIVPKFFGRTAPYPLCSYTYVPDPALALGKRNDSPDLMPPRLTEVDASGFHCVLMHRSVIEAAASVCPTNALCQPQVFKWSPEMSEDIYFCEMARKGGARLWLDTTCEVRHVGNCSVGQDMHLAYRDFLGSQISARPPVAQHAGEPPALVRRPLTLLAGDSGPGGE